MFYLLKRIKSFLLKQIRKYRRTKDIKKFNSFQARYNCDLSFSEAIKEYPDLNSLYAYMHHYFHHRCPQIIRDHRTYFKQDWRGFGDDAFNAMWWLLLIEYKPTLMLEIGVYRGQVISLWALISKYLAVSHEVHGISPFNAQGDSVSKYPENIDYLTDVLNTFAFFSLSSPVLVKALSTDQEAIFHIQGLNWDLIYIDGSHDFEIVLTDYQLCRKCLKPGGLIILDDSSLYTSFKPPLFSSAGHPGPSKVANEYAMKEMKYIGTIGHNQIFMKEDI